jgi:hypothetical protein
MQHRNLILALLASLVLGAATIPSQQTDNPQYQSWARHRPGTKLVYTNEYAAQKLVMKREISQTLKDLAPGTARLDVSEKTEVFDESHVLPSRSVDVKAKVVDGEEVLPGDYLGSMKLLEKESIDVAGRKYECTVYHFTGREVPALGTGGSSIFRGDVAGKIWRSPEIPGGVARMELQILLGDPKGTVKATMKMAVTSIETRP